MTITFVGCTGNFSEKEEERNFHLNNVKIVFPQGVTAGIATDTNFQFYYSANKKGKIKVQLDNEDMTEEYYFTLTGTTGYITVKGKNLQKGDLKITITPSPIFETCSQECKKEEFPFSFKLTNFRASEPLQILKINPCNPCFRKTNFFKITFSKALSSATAKVLKKKFEKSTFYGDAITIFTFKNNFQLPMLCDIYGRCLTSEEIFGWKKPEVFVREICIYPTKDWSDSRGGDKIAYNNKPGYGSVNSSDQFIMIENNNPEKTNFDSLHLEICNLSNCDYLYPVEDKRKNYMPESGNIIVFGDPPGTLEAGDTIKVFSGSHLKDKVKIPENFPPGGGWWREKHFYSLTPTDCTIPF